MMEEQRIRQLRAVALERRLDVLEMVYRHKSGHIGGDMSCMETLVALYYEIMDVEKIRRCAPERDRFVLSKGHNAEALYTVLADLGFLPKEELDTFTCFQARLAEHPTYKVPGIEIATGALGHGLPIAVGMALGLRRLAPQAHVYTLMGDGEQAEGSVWEAAMAAGKFGLENLTCIVDRNRLQISGDTETVMPLDDLQKKYEAFGFVCVECDGHAFDSVCGALRTRTAGKPVLVIANTIKGHGSAVMENKAQWHHAIPNDEEYMQIREDLLRMLEAE